MLRRLVNGMIAGAAGTAILNLITYLDMLLRARSSSSVPAKTAERLAEAAGAEIAAGGEQGTQSRRTAAGALLGYGAGIGIGAAYGVIEAGVPDLPAPLSGALVGAAAMAASDVPATVTGATDPRDWGTSSWLADILPHYGYGLVTVMVLRALRS